MNSLVASWNVVTLLLITYCAWCHLSFEHLYCNGIETIYSVNTDLHFSICFCLPVSVMALSSSDNGKFTLTKRTQTTTKGPTILKWGIISICIQHWWECEDLDVCIKDLDTSFKMNLSKIEIYVPFTNRKLGVPLHKRRNYTGIWLHSTISDTSSSLWPSSSSLVFPAYSSSECAENKSLALLALVVGVAAALLDCPLFICHVDIELALNFRRIDCQSDARKLQNWSRHYSDQIQLTKENKSHYTWEYILKILLSWPIIQDIALGSNNHVNHVLNFWRLSSSLQVNHVMKF